MSIDTATKHSLDFTPDQWGKFISVIELATGEDAQATDQILEAVGNDDDTNKALVNFMSGVSFGTNPTMYQIQYNQQLTNALFSSIANYIVRD